MQGHTAWMRERLLKAFPFSKTEISTWLWADITVGWKFKCSSRWKWPSRRSKSSRVQAETRLSEKRAKRKLPHPGKRSACQHTDSCSPLPPASLAPCLFFLVSQDIWAAVPQLWCLGESPAPFHASKFYYLLFTSCSQNIPTHQKYVLWLYIILDLLNSESLFHVYTSLYWIQGVCGHRYQLFFFFLKHYDDSDTIGNSEKTSQMYKYYHIINLCLFLQNLGSGGLRLLLQFRNLFGSTGHNFYRLNNEVVKTPEVIVSYTSIK